MKLLLLQLLQVASLAFAADPVEPVVIGIVAHPTTETETTHDDGTADHHDFTDGSEYIASSYIKWVQQAGGRAIGVPFGATPEQTEALFSQMNGVLFPGGATELGGSARILFELAEAANAADDFFPVWGTCLGFQWLMQLGSSNESGALCLGCFDAGNLENALELNQTASSSRLLGSISPELLAIAGSDAITFNNHHDGVRPAVFDADPGLSTNWSILSTNRGRDGEEYVSTVEHKSRPYYGIQWHAEKTLFEYYPSRINHSEHAITLSKSMGDFFISEARRSRPALPTNASDFTGALPLSRKMLPAFESVVLVVGAEATEATSPSAACAAQSSELTGTGIAGWVLFSIAALGNAIFCAMQFTKDYQQGAAKSALVPQKKNSGI